MVWYPPKVEISFTTNPLDAPVWVDVTSYVLGDITIRRGRERETESFNPGEASFTLDNRDRRFDPANTSGPYYGNLRFRRRVRIGVTISGTYYPLFVGFVQGWPQTFDYVANIGTVTISALDALSLLATAPLSGGPYRNAVLADSPVRYYRLDDVGGIAVDSSGAYDASYSLAVEEQQAPYPTDNGRARYFGFNSQAPIGYPFGTGTPPSGTQALEFWFRSEQPWFDQLSRSIVQQEAKAFGVLPQTRVGIFGAGAPTRGVVGATIYGVATYYGTKVITDGAWHHVIVYKTGTTLAIYIDGVLDRSQTVSSNYLFDSSLADYGAFSIGGMSRTVTPHAVNDLGLYGTLADVSLYSGVTFDAAKAAARYEAGRGWPNETTSDRATRILDAVGWPASERTVGVGTVRLAPQGRWEGTALERLQEIATAEHGGVYADRSGRVIYRGRFALSPRAVNWTASDASAATTRFESVAPSDDDATAYNAIVASRQGGRTFERTDAASIALYYRRALELTGLPLATDAEAENLAQYLAAYYATTAPRIASLVLNGRANDSAFTLAATAELGDRLQVTTKPLNVGSEVVYDQILERIDQTVGMASVTFGASLVGSPYNATTYFVLNSSTLNGSDVLG